MRLLNQYYYPFKVITGSEVECDIPHLENRFIKGETFIYICTTTSCQRPVQNAADAIKQLSL